MYPSLWITANGISVSIMQHMQRMQTANENVFNCSMYTLCKKNNIKIFSAQNFMDPRKVPKQLEDLSIVEQQLICRLSPAINVHMLKHGGVGANGHCVTFPQAIDEPAQIFPRLPHEIKIIRIRKQGKNDTQKDFIVRRERVQEALQWLQKNNPAYSDIKISSTRLQQLPLHWELPDIQTIHYQPSATHTSDNGPAPEQMPAQNSEQCQTNSGVLLPEPNVDIHKQISNIVADVIGKQAPTVTMHKKKHTVLPWPSRNDTPVSEFTTQYFFTLSFPCLFPYAQGDFFINRPRTCYSLAEWAEHLLWYTDGRFARHQYFKFIVHNMIMRKRALTEATFIMKQQIGDNHITVQELKQQLENGDQSTVQKMIYFAACLRGTSQYWAQRAKELRSLIQYQIHQGNALPSFFTTGSCAEFHWQALRRLLQTYMQMTVGHKPDFNNRTELFQALQQHTHIVAKYFVLRTTSYFEKIMGPVFGVNAYWYRQEFAKSRGMVHWHGLCWREDREPNNLIFHAINEGSSDQECAIKVAQWAKNQFSMTASHPAGTDASGNSRKDLWPPPEGTAPAPPEEKNPLIKLLMDVSDTQDALLEDHILLTNRINIHRCSDYCLRSTRPNQKEKKCCMEFGTQSNPGKTLREEPAFVRDKNHSLRLELERDHPMLVQHSQYHTQAWRANGDISIILSKSNPANPTVAEIMATEKYVSGYACKGNESTGALVDMFQDILHSTDQQHSSVTNLCTKLLMKTVNHDISAVEASYELSSLPLYHCSHQFQTISMTGSRILERQGTTLTKKTPLDRYLNRKEEDNSSWYQFVCNQGKVPVISGCNIHATWPLREDSCRTMPLLHWPNWRQISQIKATTQSWIEKMKEFLSMEICPNTLKADIERAKLQGNYEANNDDDSQEDNQIHDDIEHPD